MLKSGSGNQKYRSGYPYLDAKTLERHTEIEELKYKIEVLKQKVEELKHFPQESPQEEQGTECATTIYKPYSSGSNSSGSTNNLYPLATSRHKLAQSTSNYRKMIRDFAQDKDYNSFYIRFPHNEQELECLRNISDNVTKLSFISKVAFDDVELKGEQDIKRILDILEKTNIRTLTFDKDLRNEKPDCNSKNPRYFYRGDNLDRSFFDYGSKPHNYSYTEQLETEREKKKDGIIEL